MRYGRHCGTNTCRTQRWPWMKPCEEWRGFRGTSQELAARAHMPSTGIRRRMEVDIRPGGRSAQWIFKPQRGKTQEEERTHGVRRAWARRFHITETFWGSPRQGLSERENRNQNAVQSWYVTFVGWKVKISIPRPEEFKKKLLSKEVLETGGKKAQRAHQA